MNRLMMFCFTLLVLCCFSNIAQATPMYYTFKGSVTSAYDPTSIIADSSLAVGSDVQYTFLIDFAVGGTQRLFNGYIRPMPDYSTVDIFHADYISGLALEPKDGGYWNNTQPASSGVAEYNLGSNNPDRIGGRSGAIAGNSANNKLYISSYDLVVSSWQIGTAVVGRNDAYGTTNIYSTLYAELELVSITPAPVPEPATMLLFGTGLVGLIGSRLRKKKK